MTEQIFKSATFSEKEDFVGLNTSEEFLEDENISDAIGSDSDKDIVKERMLNYPYQIISW